MCKIISQFNSILWLLQIIANVIRKSLVQNKIVDKAGLRPVSTFCNLACEIDYFRKNEKMGKLNKKERNIKNAPTNIFKKAVRNNIFVFGGWLEQLV